MSDLATRLTAEQLRTLANGAALESVSPARVYLTQIEAANYVRVSLSTFKKHVRPFVPCGHIGQKPVFRVVDLDAFMTDHTHFVVPKASRARGSAHARFQANQAAARIREELG